MELAIASGVAALGYGITKMFPKTESSTTRTEGDDLEHPSQDWAAFEEPADVEELDPGSDREEDGLEDDPRLDGYTEFQNRLPPIDPAYRPGQVLPHNGDIEGLPDGALGVPRERLPFFRESNRAQSTDVMDRKRDLFTGGTRDAWRSKQEAGALFQPQKGITNIHGAPVQTEEMMRSLQDRPVSMYRNSELLFDPERVGPGLGLGPDVPASYGFHDPTRVLPFNPGEDRIELPGRSNLGKLTTAGERPLLGQTTKEKRRLSTQDGRVGGAAFPTPIANAKPPTRVGQDKTNIRTGEIPMNRVGVMGHVGNSQGAYQKTGDYTKDTSTMRMGEIPLTRVGGAGHGASTQGGYVQDRDYTKHTTSMRMGEIQEGRVGGASHAGTQGHVNERGQETMETTRLRTAETPLNRVGIAGQGEKATGAYLQERNHTKQPGRKRNVEVPLTEVGGAAREGVGEYTDRTYLVPHTQRGTEHRGVNPAKGVQVHDPNNIGKTRLRDHDTREYTPGPQLPAAIPTKGSSGEFHIKQGYDQPTHDFSKASDQLKKNPFAITPLHQIQNC